VATFPEILDAVESVLRRELFASTLLLDSRQLELVTDPFADERGIFPKVQIYSGAERNGSGAFGGSRLVVRSVLFSCWERTRGRVADAARTTVAAKLRDAIQAALCTGQHPPLEGLTGIYAVFPTDSALIEKPENVEGWIRSNTGVDYHCVEVRPKTPVYIQQPEQNVALPNIAVPFRNRRFPAWS